MASVLVTGSSKGIGFEMALAFARVGHTVFATIRAPANAPFLAEQPRPKTSRSVYPTRPASEHSFPVPGIPPYFVAEKILDMYTSATWQLRHPVGPDAQPLIQWRRQMTDEQSIEINGGDDATFFASLAPPV